MAQDISQIPLRHRLPNPTALFVGRGKELDWLAQILADRSVVLVHGPGGIGKTAFLLQMIHERFREVVTKTLFIEVRPEEPTDQVRRTIAQMMSHVTGEPIDMGELKDDPEGLTAAAIDVADALGLWVVLEDVHHADESEMNTMLMQLASYARSSRWLVTSRSNPKLPPLMGQTLELVGMGDNELATLAQELGPNVAPHDIVRAVASASGSPWLLQQHVIAGAAEVALSREQLLSSLPPKSVEFLRALSLLRGAFPLEVLSRFAPPLDADALALLVRRGLIQRDTAGYRLHDVVSGFLFPDGPQISREHELQASRALSELDDPEAILEAARMLLHLRELDELIDVIVDHGDNLIASGFAPKLWVVIGETEDPRLEHWRLRCAAELGNPTALCAVEAPILEGPSNSLAWAQTEYARGDIDKALSLALDVLKHQRSRNDADLTTKARFLEARCLMHRGQLDEAKQRLMNVEGVDSETSLHREALLAHCDALQGESGAGVRAVETARKLRSISPLPEATHELATALALTGRFELADELLDSVLATPRGGGARLLVARQALLLRARLRLTAGELDETQRILETVRPFVRGPSLLRPFLTELDGAQRLVQGQLDGLEAIVDYALEISRSVDRACWLRSAILSERLKLSRGIAPKKRSKPIASPRSSPEALELSLIGAIRRRRFGLPSRISTQIDSHRGEVRVWGHLLASVNALLSSDDSTADREAAAACVEAERSRDLVLELESLMTWSDVLLCGGRKPEHEEVVTRLSHRARQIGATRFELEAFFMSGRGQPATLEQIAKAEQSAPVAARRAQALLGGSPLLDAVDERIVSIIHAERQAHGLSLSHIGGTLSPGEVWRSGWGLDEHNLSVWLPDGRVIDYSARPLLFRILTTLAEHEGAVTKETLFCEAWQEKEYHPLRHDSRLHVSIRKLRMELEDDPSRPTRLQTTSGGYSFGGPVRWVQQSSL